MSKGTKEEMQKSPATAAAATVAPNGLTNLATKTASEQMKALQEMLGGDAGDVEVILGGTLPFWPAVAGAVLVGVIQNYSTRITKYKNEKNPTGEVGLYTFQVQERSALAGTSDGEVFEVQPGDLINVLERDVMKEFRTHIGQRVAVLNLGKKMGRNGFEYWDYKVIGKRRTAEQIQAANALAQSTFAKSDNGNA